MSAKRPHPDANDVVARARAAIAAKYAKLSTEHKSPKAGVTNEAPVSASLSAKDQQRQQPPSSAAPGPTPSAISADLQKRLEEAKARARAVAASKAQQAQREKSQREAAEPQDLLLANKRNSMRTKFATTMANRKNAEDPKYVPKGKQLEILKGPADDFMNREKNPYFDHKLGGRDTSRPMDRKSKALQFSAPGKYIDRANKVREEEHLKALQARIAATARRVGLEDDLDVSGRAIAKQEPPEIEWWDAPYTKNESYSDIDTKLLNLHAQDGPITAMIQHPIPIPAPSDLNAPPPAPLKYTKREHKKIRNQERAAKQKDKQDKQRLGLIPPDPPKVKLSNMATVLAQSSVQDPTKIEQEVKAQVQSRKDQHEQMNEERKLSKEEKQEKAAQKLAEDEAKGIRAAAWRIEIMANGYHRRRVDENAQQCGLTGVVVLNPRFNLVYAEGGAKSIKFFKKLMENRIEWTEGPRSALASHPDTGTSDQGEESAPNYGGNKCTCIWEGELKKRAFGAFRYKKCQFEGDVKEALKAETYTLWNIAKNSKDE